MLGALGDTRIVARGPKAAGAVQAAGLAVWRRAANEQMDPVQAHLLAEPLAGAPVAVQLYGTPAPAITGALSDAGAAVVEVPVYQWRTLAEPALALRLAQAAIDGRLHAVTFTAAPAAANLFALAAGAGIAGSPRGPVQPRCGGRLRRGGVRPGRHQRRHRLPPVVPPVGRLG